RANRLRLYAARINLAQQAWERGDTRLALELLDSLRPGLEEPDGEDLRGFEWFYLWRLCHSERCVLRGHAGPGRAVAVGPPGETLATGGNDCSVKLWDPATGRLLRTLKGHTGWVTGVAFTPDGKLMATASADRTVRLWNSDAPEQSAVLRGHTEAVSCLA